MINLIIYPHTSNTSSTNSTTNRVLEINIHGSRTWVISQIGDTIVWWA